MTLFINGKTYEAGELITYVENLEKENAELKKKNLDTQYAVTMQMYTNKANKEIADRQLTKAKEIIKDLLNLPFASNEEVFADVGSHLYKAEQFLSEVEK